MQIAPGFSEPNSPDPKARGEKRLKKGAKENEKEIQAEYIAKMHALASTLEEEIKHLKGKEVDQKNQSKGLELFMFDGIPLNEHFLSLKSKYNSDFAYLKEEYNKLSEQVRSQEYKNKGLGHKINALRRDCKHDADLLVRVKAFHKNQILE